MNLTTRSQRRHVLVDRDHPPADDPCTGQRDRQGNRGQAHPHRPTHRRGARAGDQPDRGCRARPRGTPVHRSFAVTWMADARVPVSVPRKIAGHGSLPTQRQDNPDVASITTTGESLTAFLSARRSPNSPQLRMVPNPKRSTRARRKPADVAFRPALTGFSLVGVTGFNMTPALRSYLLERSHATGRDETPAPVQPPALPQRRRWRDRLSEHPSRMAPPLPTTPAPKQPSSRMSCATSTPMRTARYQGRHAREVQRFPGSGDSSAARGQLLACDGADQRPDHAPWSRDS